MIFVTVGTHEQPFDRLIKEVDDLKKNGKIIDEVFMQIGYSNYKPKYCKYKSFLSYDEMSQKITKSKIVITHGGPASFIEPLSLGKVPIVVPRKKEYNEHVNDHQVEFANVVKKTMNNIIVIENIDDLSNTINNYDMLIKKLSSKISTNNSRFNVELQKIIKNL